MTGLMDVARALVALAARHHQTLSSTITSTDVFVRSSVTSASTSSTPLLTPTLTLPAVTLILAEVLALSLVMLAELFLLSGPDRHMNVINIDTGCSAVSSHSSVLTSTLMCVGSGIELCLGWYVMANELWVHRQT